MSRRRLVGFPAPSLWLAGLLVAASGYAQVGPWLTFDLGALEGRARGPGGAPVGGASVRLGGAVARVAATGADGRFSFPGLVPGRYSVEVSHEGFVTSVVEDIDVESGGVLYLRFELVPGRATSLTVTSMPVIDTSRASGRVGTGRSELALLPLGGVIAGLDALLPPERGPRLLGGLEVGGGHRVSIWDHLAVDRVEAAALATSDLDPGLDFIASPVRLLVRGVDAPWHVSAGVLLTGPALAEGTPHGFSGRRSTLRPNLSAGGQWGDRVSALVAGALDRETFDEGSVEQGVASPILRLDTRLGLGRLDGQPSQSWRLGGLYLNGRGVGSDERPEIVERLARLEAIGVPVGAIEVGVLVARAEYRGGAPLAQPAIDDSRAGFRLGWSRGAQVLRVGGIRERTAGGGWLDPRRDSGSRSALWVEERLRLGRVSLQLGLRARDREGSLGSSPRAADRRELLPRAGVSWDIAGDGQWSLFAHAGEYGELGVDVDETRSSAKRRRAGIGLRHQLVPGVVLEAEANRRRATAFVDDPESAPTLGLTGIRLDTIRLGGRAAIGRRATSTLEYQRSELDVPALPGEAGEGLDASQLVLTATWAFERGLEAGTVVRYRQGEWRERAPAWPTFPAQPVAEPRFELDQHGSLAEVAIALGYRLPIQLDAERPWRATLRLEVSNLLDDRLEDRARSESEARRLWLGFRIER